MSKRTVSSGLGSLGSGAVTAAALAVQTGLAAVVGIVLAREFGRSAETDGFFAAYGVFAVVVLAATAMRMTILPPLARAREERRLAGETASYALAVSGIAVPLVAVAFGAADAVAWLLTGAGPDLARQTAAGALPWMMLAAVGQLYAALGASALAALDDYAVAAAGYVLGSVAGLALILLRVDTDGIAAISWGMALNGAIAVAVPTLALAVRARAESVSRAAARPHGPGILTRLRELARGAALPLAMQAIYLLCLPFAAREGVGAVTSFGYAYLVSAAVVATTASSLALVTAVPLTRAGLDPAASARHVVSSSWLALAAVGAVAGGLGLAGEPVADALLGGAYGSDVGSELGELVVAFAPWAVAAVAFSVTYPLVFVAGQGGRLPLLAVGIPALHIVLALLGQLIFGLTGLALALAVSTAVVVAVLLSDLHVLEAAVRGLAVAALAVGIVAAVAFLPVGFLLEPAVAAVLGVALYAVGLAVWRPRGLRAAWQYLRALG